MSPFHSLSLLYYNMQTKVVFDIHFRYVALEAATAIISDLGTASYTRVKNPFV